MKSRGTTLIETLVYISVLVMIFGIFTTVVLSVSKSYMTLATARNLDTAAISVMERITREIRSSSSVNAASVLNITPGVLSLDQTNAASVTTNTFFHVVNNNIQIKINGDDQGALLPSGAVVTRLVFNSIDSGRSMAVKVEMQIGGQTYYSTVVLRGSYQ